MSTPDHTQALEALIASSAPERPSHCQPLLPWGLCSSRLYDGRGDPLCAGPALTYTMLLRALGSKPAANTLPRLRRWVAGGERTGGPDWGPKQRFLGLCHRRCLPVIGACPLRSVINIAPHTTDSSLSACYVPTAVLRGTGARSWSPTAPGPKPGSAMMGAVTSRLPAPASSIHNGSDRGLVGSSGAAITRAQHLAGSRAQSACCLTPGYAGLREGS